MSIWQSNYLYKLDMPQRSVPLVPALDQHKVHQCSSCPRNFAGNETMLNPSPLNYNILERHRRAQNGQLKSWIGTYRTYHMKTCWDASNLICLQLRSYTSNSYAQYIYIYSIYIIYTVSTIYNTHDYLIIPYIDTISIYICHIRNASSPKAKAAWNLRRFGAASILAWWLPLAVRFEWVEMAMGWLSHEIVILHNKTWNFTRQLCTTTPNLAISWFSQQNNWLLCSCACSFYTQ